MLGRITSSAVSKAQCHSATAGYMCMSVVQREFACWYGILEFLSRRSGFFPTPVVEWLWRDSFHKVDMYMDLLQYIEVLRHMQTDGNIARTDRQVLGG